CSAFGVRTELVWAEHRTPNTEHRTPGASRFTLCAPAGWRSRLPPVPGGLHRGPGYRLLRDPVQDAVAYPESPQWLDPPGRRRGILHRGGVALATGAGDRGLLTFRRDRAARVASEGGELRVLHQRRQSVRLCAAVARRGGTGKAGR